MAIDWTNAPEVREIAERLIPEYHSHLLDEVDIEYVFRSEAAQQGGKTILGKARKICGLNVFLSKGHDYFCIEVAGDIWTMLTEPQREALVDHELEHFSISFDEEGRRKLMIRAHDLEEFSAIVERHGLRKKDIEEFLKAAKGIQLTLGEDAEEERDLNIEITHDGKTVRTTTEGLKRAADAARRVTATIGAGEGDKE